MSTIFWDDRSPSDSGAARVPIPVWNLAPNKKAFVRFLGPWRGVWLHWLDHSFPCCGGGCPFCAEGRATFWMGYAPALLWDAAWKAIVCPVSESVADVLGDRQLAGLVVELHRRGRRPNSPWICAVIDRPLKDVLPPAFDVEPILRRLWRLRLPSGRRMADAGVDAPPPAVLPFVPPDDGQQRKETQS